MITLEIIAKVGLFISAVMLIWWQLRRKPYRDGYRIRMTPPSQPAEPPAPRIRIPQPDDEADPNIIDGHFA
jgi:hypothetical protein